LCKYALNLLVIAVIAQNGDAFALNVAHICGASACDMHDKSSIAKLQSNTFSNASTGACHNGNAFACNHSLIMHRCIQEVLNSVNREKP
jgi:hypothetical protein